MEKSEARGGLDLLETKKKYVCQQTELVFGGKLRLLPTFREQCVSL
jgi:hypothetical protein